MKNLRRRSTKQHRHIKAWGKERREKKLVETDVGEEEEVYYILYQSIFSR